MSPNDALRIWLVKAYMLGQRAQELHGQVECGLPIEVACSLLEKPLLIRPRFQPVT